MAMVGVGIDFRLIIDSFCHELVYFLTFLGITIKDTLLNLSAG